MGNITQSLTISSFMTYTTDILLSISPYLALLLGVLLAFSILKWLVELIQSAQDKNIKKINIEKDDI